MIESGLFLPGEESTAYLFTGVVNNKNKAEKLTEVLSREYTLMLGEPGYRTLYEGRLGIDFSIWASSNIIKLFMNTPLP